MKIQYRLLYDDEIHYFASPEPPGYLVSIVKETAKFSEADAVSWINARSHAEFEMELDEETTMGEIAVRLCQELHLKPSYLLDAPSAFHILTGKFLLGFEKYDVKFSQISQFGISDVLNVCLVFSTLQGEVLRKGQIYYYMPSHEGNRHNRPHVHVLIEHSYEASVGIENLQILDGKIPQKYRRTIKTTIKEHQQFLLECWNSMTDGINVDINVGMDVTKIQY